MTLTQLEYVLAVHEHKHFGRAAKSCFVTQPTLSMQLQKLEEELQITIFDRAKNPIEVTAEGEVVVEQAKKIILEHKKLYSIVEESKSEIQGSFRLAVIPTLSPFIIPMFAKSFNENFPKVNLHITESKTEDIIRMLKDDEIDAGLLVTPLHEKNIKERKLYYEPFYLFVSEDHPLAKKELIKEDELDINEIWLLNKGNCFRDQVLRMCSKTRGQNLTNPIDFESGNFETLKNMVLAGSGYTVLPHMAIQQLPEGQKKLVRRMAAPAPIREVSLVHKKDCVKQKILGVLEEEILANVPDDLREMDKDGQQIIEIL
tara:strand:- start:106130 stop:107074 length:945 start_codon:yes stop_codon:yes gene_type:complete